MSDDIVFGIGADNSDLKQTTSEADQIISSWVNDVKDRFNDIGNLEVAIASGDAEAAMGSLLKISEEMSNELSLLPGKAGELAGRLAGVLGVAQQVWSIGVEIKDTIIEQQKEASGLNDELERAVRFEKEALEIKQERLSLRKNQASDEIDQGENKTLEALKAEQAARLKVQAAREKALATSKLERDALEEMNVLWNASARHRIELADKRKNVKRDQGALDEVNAEIKATGKVIEDLEKKQKAIDDAKIKRQKELNDKLQDALSISNELAMKARGDVAGAEKERDSRLRRQREKQFDDVGGKQAADQLAVADKAARSAKKVADAKKEQDRENDKQRRLQEQFDDRKERHMERISDAKKRIAEFDEDSGRKIARLRSKHQRDRKRENRAIGGFDSSIEAAFSRIQSAANKPKDDEREESRHRRMVELEVNAELKRERIAKALEKLVDNPPEKPKGML